MRAPGVHRESAVDHPNVRSSSTRRRRGQTSRPDISLALTGRTPMVFYFSKVREQSILEGNFESPLSGQISASGRTATTVRTSAAPLREDLDERR